MTAGKFMKAALIIAFGSIAFSSCKKDHSESVPPPVEAKKLWKVKMNESDSILLAYTTTGELSKVITTTDGDGQSLTTYTMLYDPSSRLTEISSSDGRKHKFVYENGQLKLAENYQGTKKVSENYFEFANGRIVSNTLFMPLPNNEVITYKPTFKVSYAYGNSGDVVNTTTYTMNPNGTVLKKYSERIIEQYDDSKNPLSVLKYLTLLSVYELPGNKNILKEKLLDSDGGVEEATINTYVYDAEKNPISATSVLTPAGGSPITTNFKYYYK